MTQPIREFPRLRYAPLIVAAVFAFYALNVDGILGTQRYSPFAYQILLFLGVLAAATVVHAANSEGPSLRAHFSDPVLIGAFAYLCISGLSLGFAYDPTSAAEGIRYALSTALILCSAVIAFSCSTRAAARHIGYTALVVLVIACVSLYLDPIVDFRSRIGGWGAYYDRTRAGGVFLQPNIAGTAVPFILATVVSRVRPGIALASVVLSLGAVVLTFSREGMLLLALVISLAFLRGYLPRVLSMAAVLACATLLAGVQVTGVIQTVFHVNQGDGLARMSDATSYVSASAVTSDSRVDVAQAALNEALRAPLTGRGIGYSWYWARSEPNQVGPHNMYLRYMLEYGVLGLLIWPLFLWQVYRVRNRALDRSWVFGLLGAAVVAAFFSHNLAEEGVFLVPLIGAITLPVPMRCAHPQPPGRGEVPADRDGAA